MGSGISHMPDILCVLPSNEIQRTDAIISNALHSNDFLIDKHDPTKQNTN
jgi:hypothetical protein